MERAPEAIDRGALRASPRMLRELFGDHLRDRSGRVGPSSTAPTLIKPKGYIDGSIARSHVSTARVLTVRRARP